GRAPLALEEAAGDLARGIGLLSVVDGEREEALAGLGGFRRRDRSEHHGVVHRAEYGAVRLAGDFPGFQRDLLRAEGEGFLDRVQRGSSVWGRKQKRSSVR